MGKALTSKLKKKMGYKCSAWVRDNLVGTGCARLDIAGKSECSTEHLDKLTHWHKQPGHRADNAPDKILPVVQTVRLSSGFGTSRALMYPPGC